jgi:hypothetical protein
MALVQSTGKLTFLRVHNVGSRFGPSADQIDVEVVTKLTSEPKRAMGFQLRNDSNRLARQGMLDLLRDAFTHNFTVTIDYDLPSDKTNGVAIRVTLTKRA